MAVSKMKLVNIVGRLRDFDSVVQQCCIKGDFHPEMSSQAVGDLEEFRPVDDINPYEHGMQTAVDVGVHSNIHLHYSDFSSLGMTDSELCAYVDGMRADLTKLNGRVTELIQQSDSLRQMLTPLAHIRGFGISLDELFGCKNILFKFGRLPKDGYYRMNDDESCDNRLFFPLEEDALFFWGFYVTRRSEAAQAAEFYASLYFENVGAIEKLHGTPAQAYDQVKGELEALEPKIAEAKEAVSKYIGGRLETYLKVYSKLRFLHDSFDIRRYASKVDDNFYIFGWVPESEIGVFTSRFEKLPNVDCIVEDTEDAGKVAPPTKLVNHKIFRPFELFVGMYGLPVYNEIDPTPFVALTYTIIYGIMFADLGQGAIIFGVGLWLWMKTHKPLGGIMYRIGAASMFFGVLFNEFFGKEFLPVTLLQVNPIRYSGNTVLMLGATIGIGILLIIICMVMNIINGIRQKRTDKYLFSPNGIAGLVFYVTVLLAVALGALMNLGMSPAVIVLCIVLPLVLIALSEPLSKLLARRKDWKPKNPGEYGISAFFELFEALLSYATNTISFVRVGAYVLSHAGMMTAAFALAGVAGTIGSIPILIICNAFVLLLEGFIVAIQGIRLQYYEMFSRFYDGTGKKYSPVTIHYE
jgi:V/A-type H+-transporting ATPase subunit I